MINELQAMQLAMMIYFGMGVLFFLGLCAGYLFWGRK